MKKILMNLSIGVIIAIIGLMIVPDVVPKAYALASRTFTYVAHCFKKSVIIGSTTNNPADSSAWLQIGDTMGARYHLYMPPTDTNKIAISKRKFGDVVLQRSDTTLYLWVGNTWRKYAYQ